jgi:glycosyltransferase involved in cell wall biosynthesis
VIPVLLKDRLLNNEFNLVFLYKYSSSYAEGLRSKLDLDDHDISGVEYKFEKYLNNAFFSRTLDLFQLPLIVLDILSQFKRFKSIAPDLVLINNGGYPAARTCRSAAITSRLLGITNCLFVVNNIAVPYNSLKRQLDRPIDYLVKRCTALFLTASIAARSSLIEVLQLSDHKVAVLVNTFDMKPVTISSQMMRQKLRIPEGYLVIGSVGELSTRKGHAIFIEAILKLVSSGEQRVRVLIIGDGPEKSELKQMIARHRLEEFISLIPFSDNISNYYNVFDLYIHTSIEFDDLPFAVREAMSMGLPTIASNIGGIPELICDDHNGLLFESGDAQDLSAKIAELIKDVQRRERIGKQNLEEYKKKYDKGRIIKEYIALFEGYTK